MTILRRGQVFAMDLIMATVLFVAAFALFYGFLTYLIVEPEEKVLGREGQHVIAALATDESPANILDAQELNVTKLELITTKDYQSLKSELGIKNDFCIYLEDEEGNLIEMSNNKKSMGNRATDIKLTGGLSCGD